MSEKKLKEKVIKAAKEYYAYEKSKRRPFRPGDRISYAGRVYDEKEIANLIEASLDFWLTVGRFTERFEKDLAAFLGTRHCMLVNSGSSANLLALMALTSPVLGERRIRRGDEVITVAAGFPTTVAPIVQYGAVPVFIDVELPSYNVNCAQLEEALTKKTKAVMIAHTLGNPFNISAVKKFCRRHGLWFIEDNCDSLGSRYFMDGKWHYTGTFGDIGTSSFYPPHHITMGEGGAVYTDNPRLKRIIESMRDWGRDCWCAPGKDDTCGHRFDRRFGKLPLGYDHKYVYSHFGYNLKVTDLQSAIGCAQLEKLPRFINARRANWQKLRKALEPFSDIFILPEETKNAKPSWFGFLITLRDGIHFQRRDIVQYLERKGIQTRMLFAGNLTKHPCFDAMDVRSGEYRVVGDLSVTDKIMNDTFWIGVYPGLTDTVIRYMIRTIKEFAAKKER